jgi:hypothetical protein
MKSNETRIANSSALQRILIEGREHYDQPDYDPECRLKLLRASQCKTPQLGGRAYASEDEEQVFYNTCKSRACSSCGHWSTIQWQRERWCALPECPYRAVTLTMPNTLWPLFASNPQLCRKLAEIAARVIVGYVRVRHGVEVGVMPILHTRQFKPSSHTRELLRNRDDRIADCPDLSEDSVPVYGFAHTSLNAGEIPATTLHFDERNLLHAPFYCQSVEQDVVKWIRDATHIARIICERPEARRDALHQLAEQRDPCQSEPLLIPPVVDIRNPSAYLTRATHVGPVPAFTGGPACVKAPVVESTVKVATSPEPSFAT